MDVYQPGSLPSRSLSLLVPIILAKSQPIDGGRLGVISPLSLYRTARPVSRPLPGGFWISFSRSSPGEFPLRGSDGNSLPHRAWDTVDSVFLGVYLEGCLVSAWLYLSARGPYSLSALTEGPITPRLFRGAL